MSLLDTISADFIAALKGREERSLAILRMLKAAIKNQEIEKRQPLNDAEIVSVIRKQIKQLEEAAADFERGGRADLAGANREEIKILQKYPPPTLSDEEARILVEQAVAEAKAAGAVLFGPIMGAVMKKLAGQVEGNKVKDLVNKYI